MALYHFHRVLIAAAILFDFFFSLFCIRRYNLHGEVMDLVYAIGSSAISVGFILYLIHFNRKVARYRANLDSLLCPNCQYDLRGSLARHAATCPECGSPISEELRRRAATA
ncbi:MAG: hypothetical protein WD768_10055 [Phycisphaeraceae bacterium]